MIFALKIVLAWPYKSKEFRSFQSVLIGGSELTLRSATSTDPPMASFNKSLLIALVSLSVTVTVTATAIDTAAVTGSDIHDILSDFGLPIGILPDAVESYTLSPTDGAFTVYLTRPCYVKFDDQTVYYSKNIQGKLTYGSVSDVTGIQAKQLFLWLSVTGMDLDTNSGMIEFHVGVLSKKLPADLFQEVPECKSKACEHESYIQSI